MLRSVITPDQRKVSIELPQNFVGKQVEVIAFTLEDAVTESLVADKTLTHFASEKSLEKDWLTTDEDIAWKDL